MIYNPAQRTCIPLVINKNRMKDCALIINKRFKGVKSKTFLLFLNSINKRICEISICMTKLKLKILF